MNESKCGGISTRTAFTLVELLIVVVILGILGTVAMSVVGAGVKESDAAAMAGDLHVMRSAIERYTAEHGRPPSSANVASQLTMYTDLAGNTSPDRTTAHRYGPYLPAIAVMRVGQQSGQAEIMGMPTDHVEVTSIPLSSTFGWCYHEDVGFIHAMVTNDQVDPRGKRYYDY